MNEKYRLRYLERYAVRDDEEDCNQHKQFCLRGGQRTADYNPSVTSLRTGDTSPCTGEAFSPAGGTKVHPLDLKKVPKSLFAASPVGRLGRARHGGDGAKPG